MNRSDDDEKCSDQYKSKGGLVVERVVGLCESERDLAEPIQIVIPRSDLHAIKLLHPVHSFAVRVGSGERVGCDVMKPAFSLVDLFTCMSIKAEEDKIVDCYREQSTSSMR